MNCARLNVIIVLQFLLFMLFHPACARTDDNDAYLPLKSWNKAEWISAAVGSIRDGRYPRIRAISYWHERWENSNGTFSDLRINSSPGALAAYIEAVADPVFVADSVFSGGILDVPAGNGIYHSAFPFFGNEEDVVTAESITGFESLAGKAITWAYFSNNWIGGDIKFPSVNANTIRTSGRIPYIRMMMRSQFEDPPDPVFTLDDIINGTHDTALTQWAKDAAAYGDPLIVEFGTEVNGEWFPWNGRWNGGSVTTGYGDPAKADGPERFVDAYRHIVTLCRTNGATNITWVFHVDADSLPDEEWNSMAAYYPGDAYIDWIGISVYGPLTPDEDYQNFIDRMDVAYPKLAALSAIKPLALLEYGIAEARTIIIPMQRRFSAGK